jgi:hypothetical protein
MHPRRNAERRVFRPETGKRDTRFVSADVAMARLAGDERGVLALAELRRCGLADDEVDSRARTGRLHRLHQGVYAVGHLSLTREAVWVAAVKACGERAALSHYSAAAHWGFVEWDDRTPEVTVPGPGSRRHPKIRVHRSKLLTRRDVMIRDGIPVTSPAWTLLDLAAVLPGRPLRRAVREAMAQRRVAIRQLADVVRRAGSRRGAGKLARIIAAGYTPTESVLSDTVLDLILAGGFVRPDVGEPLVIAGRRLVPDFRWPKQRLIVEADGAQWHDHKLAKEDDAERQAILEAHGERLVRVTWNQALTRRHQTLARLATAGAPKR